MAERILPVDDSLVKYDHPVIVAIHEDKKPSDKDENIPVAPKCFATVDINREIKEILNNIVPPREWEAEGQLWRQEVSITPATRLDVINLEEQLDMRLQQRQAKETGICPVRRELYNQCFNEVIRQETLNCAERGLMLLRVRDELHMTLEAYKSLYCSSIAFGMRKALQSEQGKENYEYEIQQLEEANQELEKQAIELNSRALLIERRAEELRETEGAKRSEEIQLLKRGNQQLKAQLEGIIAPKK